MCDILQSKVCLGPDTLSGHTSLKIREFMRLADLEKKLLLQLFQMI